MRNSALRFMIILAILSLFISTVGTATSNYAISSSSSIDTPKRTVEVAGVEYTVSSVGRVSPGEDLRINTRAPTDVEYDIYLYNAKREIVDVKSGTGDESVEFSTTYLDAGSYMTAIYGPDGNIEGIHPVVIEGFDVTVKTPDTLSEGEQLEVTVSLERLSENADLHSVEVVVMQDGSLVKRATTTQTNNHYTVTIESLQQGEYRVYAVARNETVVRDQHELIGISSAASVSVSTTAEQSTTSPKETSSGTQEVSEETLTQSASPTTALTETTVVTSTTESSVNTTQQTRGSSTGETRMSSTPTDSRVLTPDPVSSTSRTTSTTSDGPWVGGLLVVIILTSTVLKLRQA